MRTLTIKGRITLLYALLTALLPAVLLPVVYGAVSASLRREMDSQLRSAIAQVGGAVEDVTDYTIPGTEVTHRVVRIRKERSTPAGFPRAFARIKKAPLR